MIKIHSLTPHLYRVPLNKPVVTSFGTMDARWALWVSVQDQNGTLGWGEIWCNFPESGALHRCRLLQDIFAPFLPTLTSEHPATLSAQISTHVHILRLQSAEFGPLDQCVAGLDAALWDLYARRLGQPLHCVLAHEIYGDQFSIKKKPRIRAYASGINPKGTKEMIDRASHDGHSAFKVKVGFGDEQDIRTLQEARDAAGQSWLAADANQAWNLDHAMALLPKLNAFDLAWLEEPIPADSSKNDWQIISKLASMPLAAGENINHLPTFKEAIHHWDLGVIQPDCAKWGGITGCLDVIKLSHEAGLMYCPHFLGGGIGLLTSAHLLAASGQDGLLEMDVNLNPLRTEMLAGELVPQNGFVTLNDEPGIGIEPDLSALKVWAHPVPTY